MINIFFTVLFLACGIVSISAAYHGPWKAYLQDHMEIKALPLSKEESETLETMTQNLYGMKMDLTTEGLAKIMASFRSMKAVNKHEVVILLDDGEMEMSFPELQEIFKKNRPVVPEPPSEKNGTIRIPMMIPLNNGNGEVKIKVNGPPQKNVFGGRDAPRGTRQLASGRIIMRKGTPK